MIDPIAVPKRLDAKRAAGYSPSVVAANGQAFEEFATMQATEQRRLLMLEQGVERPLDYALAPGRTELADCGVIIDFDGSEVQLSWLGFGPSAFVLPGARQLRKGTWTTVETGARVSWAGRDWSFATRALPGGHLAPERGVCLNGAGNGRISNSVLLVSEGKDRGNFYRFRSEPSELVPDVWFHHEPEDSNPCLWVKVRPLSSKGLVSVDGTPVDAGASVEVEPGQTIVARRDEDVAGIAVLVVTM